MSRNGSRIQGILFHMMATPPVVKNASTLNDETATGWNREKVLSLVDRSKEGEA